MAGETIRISFRNRKDDISQVIFDYPFNDEPMHVGEEFTLTVKAIERTTVER